MILHLNIIGFILLGLALAHILFPKYFRWKEEFKPLLLINRQMMYVHTFFIGLVVFLMGLLCLTSASELVHSSLGKTISIGLAIFWTCRLLFQIFIYSSALWKGKRKETTIHILFIGFWVYFSVVFWMIYVG